MPAGVYKPSITATGFSMAVTERDRRAPAVSRIFALSTTPKSYRIYIYDRHKNDLSYDWLKADSDDAAIAAASAGGFGARCEIWDGRRLVAELDRERRQA